VSREITGPFEFAGESIRARVTINPDELAHRLGGSLSVPPADVLEALFILPHKSIVPVASLPSWARAALQDAPSWTIERQAQTIRRRYQPIGTVHEVVLDDAELALEAQIEKLEWLAAVTPRSLLVRSDMADLDTRLVAEAAGVGLIAARSTGAWVSVAPAPTARVRSTAQRGASAERAVATLSPSAAGPSSTP
jgi:hypothetical protein